MASPREHLKEMKVSIEYKDTPPQVFVAKLNRFLQENKPDNWRIHLKWTESAIKEPSCHSRSSDPDPPFTTLQGVAKGRTLKGYSVGEEIPVLSGPDDTFCPHCLFVHCIITIPPDFLTGSGPPHLRNQEKRFKLYQKFWGLLNTLGLWRDERYLQRKREKTVENDRREIIPQCIVSEIRRRYPNPPGVLYVDYQSTFDA